MNGIRSTVFVSALLAGAAVAPGQCASAGAALGSGLTNGSQLPTGNCAVALPPGGAVIGGDFTFAGGVAANRIARWDGSAWHALASGMDDVVLDLAVAPNGDLFASGRFGWAGGIRAQHLARWDGATWHPLGKGGPPVQGHSTDRTAIAIQSNGVLLSDGNRDLGGGAHASAVMRFDRAKWAVVGGSMGRFDDLIHTIVVASNGDLLVGGAFSSVGGIAAEGVARWDGNTWAGLGSGVISTARPRFVDEILERPNGDLIVAGYFTAAGGAPANCIARWDGAVWSDVGGGVNQAVLGLAVTPDGDLVAAGDFTKAGGARVARVARYDGTWSPVGAGADSAVHDLLWLPAGELLGCGAFATLAGAASNGAGRIRSSCAAFAAPITTACVSSSGPLRLVAEQLPWLGARYHGRCEGFAPSAIALAVFGFRGRQTALRSLHPSGLPGCDLLVDPDFATLELASRGAATFRVDVPAAVPLLGLQFRQQFLQGELAQGTVVRLSSSNALRLTVGAF